MSPKSYLLLALLLSPVGVAQAQYSRTPAGETIDTRILGHTPDSLTGRAIVDSSGQVIGRFDGVVLAGPATYAVVAPQGQRSGTRQVVVRLGEFKIDRQGRVTTSKSAQEIAGSPIYSGQAGYQPVTGNNLTIGDGIGSYD
jgi:hypothetical protein